MHPGSCRPENVLWCDHERNLLQKNSTGSEPPQNESVHKCLANSIWLVCLSINGSLDHDNEECILLSWNVLMLMLDAFSFLNKSIWPVCWSINGSQNHDHIHLAPVCRNLWRARMILYVFGMHAPKHLRWYVNVHKLTHLSIRPLYLYVLLL